MREMDLGALRARLSAGSGPTYWRGLDELADTPEFREMLHREFPEAASEFDDPKGRREFIKLMGASLALAGVTGCTRMPAEKIVPYVRAPEEIVPGRPLYFATALPLGAAATPVLVESHMGRPTKIEPNPEHPATLGGTDVFSQGSILTLYDPDRSKTVRYLGDIRPWSEFLPAIQAAMTAQRALKGAGLRLLTETVTSPTLAAEIESLLADLPDAKWIQYDAVSRDDMRAASRLAFGEYVDPIYHFDRAEVVLSLDADFLSSGPGRLRYTRDFIAKRRLTAGQTTMNRLYVVESTPSTTGIKADHRVPLRATDVERVARAVAAALGVVGVTAPAEVPGLPAGLLDALVGDLRAHRGRSLVVAGDEQPPAVHVLAHAINDALGNAGETVEYVAAVTPRPTEQLAELRALVREMHEGKVDLLVVMATNPVYSAPPDLRFAEAMQKVTLRVHLGLYDDETGEYCQWHVPEAHPLEAWGDTRAFDGTVSIVQPLIAPLYEGKSALELVVAMSPRLDRRAYDVVREYWQRGYDARATGDWGTFVWPDGTTPGTFEDFWRRSVHDGYIPGTASRPKPVAFNGAVVASLAAPAPAEGLEVVIRPCPHVWDGRFANNGWLQEAPRPVTKIAWDNVALVSERTARELGVLNEDLATLTVGEASIKVPVWILPGQAHGSVHLTLGYGRRRAGRVGNGVGVDVTPVRAASAPWQTVGATLRANGERYPLACTQGHFAMEGRHHLRAGTLGTYKADPEFAHHYAHSPDENMTLYGNPWKYEGYAWGMSIDLNSCTGCNACVVACVSENNIPVVGKDQVRRQREMHWIRVDRYYTGSVDDPDMYYQPMMCQHCENAPCEVVCPVAATVHSDEGLNDMVYNRCVGTRYCSHNCPYKVRRFNFFLYSDWDTPSLKMARNPDVTVRSRGVMEKCSYCVQRINHARIDAKREDRKIRDGEVVAACEAACPAQAIVFGDLNDPTSRVAKLREEPRGYKVLDELNTRPRTTYLAAVKNPNPALAPAGGHGADHTTAH